MMPSLLFDNDLKNVAKKINLPVSKTIILTEDEENLDLLLDSISENKFSKKDYKTLSFATYCKFLIYKLTKNKDFCTFEDRNFIAQSLCVSYFGHKKRNKKNYLIRDSTLKTIEDAQHYLILLSVFPDKFYMGISKSRLKSLIESKLWQNHKNIAKNLDKWIEVLGKIRAENWL